MSTKKKRNSRDSSKLPLAWAPKKVATLQSESEEWGSEFDKVTNRHDTYPVDPAFRWVTTDRQILKPQEMNTLHLWNSLKIIWNHTIPVPFRLMPYKPYEGIEKWSRSSRKWAISNLFNELMNRTDRSKTIDAGLFQMAEHLIANKHLKLL